MLHPMQADTQVTERAFEFLLQRGFHLDERWLSGGQSFKDGWRLSYSSANLRVVIQYLDQQFEIRFIRARFTASYFAIDRELFARRSEYFGDMFPPEKLEAAVIKIANDIRENYGRILAGDDDEWNRITRLYKDT